MPTVIVGSPVLHHQPGEHTAILEAAGFTVRYPEPSGDQMTEEQLLANLDGVDAALAGAEPYTRKVLESFPQLRVISRTGVGYDAVDLAAAAERKIPVCVTPGTNHDAVAEQAWALYLALAKEVVRFHGMVAKGEFARGITRPIWGQTLGIVGLGRIGKAMAVRARAFGMRVIAYDPYATAEMASDGTELVTLDELLAKSDVISLHAPMCPETDCIVRAETIAKMKDGVYIINTARGGLVEESALAAALASGKVGGAGLDVFANEPPVGSPLLTAPNVVFSPHVAGISQDSLRRMAVMGAQTIVDLFEGRWPAERIINAEQIGPRWKW